jgi:hypothetical protein
LEKGQQGEQTKEANEEQLLIHGKSFLVTVQNDYRHAVYRTWVRFTEE